MVSILEKKSIQQVSDLLGVWLKVHIDEVRVESGLDDRQIDGFIHAGNFKFMVASKANSSAAQIISAIQSLKWTKASPAALSPV
jgi:hypothetical protein